MFILFLWLLTIGSEFYFSDVKLDESYRWRHQSKLQRCLSNSQKILDLKNGWIFLILDFKYGYLSSIPCPIFSPFLQNLKGRSGNSQWIEILKNRESEDSVIENFYFFVLSITHQFVNPDISSFFDFRLTWLNYSVRKRSSYSFWNHRQ